MSVGHGNMKICKPHVAWNIGVRSTAYRCIRQRQLLSCDLKWSTTCETVWKKQHSLNASWQVYKHRFWASFLNRKAPVFEGVDDPTRGMEGVCCSWKVVHTRRPHDGSLPISFAATQFLRGGSVNQGWCKPDGLDKYTRCACRCFLLFLLCN